MGKKKDSKEELPEIFNDTDVEIPQNIIEDDCTKLVPKQSKKSTENNDISNIDESGWDKRIKKISATKSKKKDRDLGSIEIFTASEIDDIERLPTGIKALDEMLNGGLLRGRFNQFWGKADTCKSTTALITIKNAQSKGYKNILYMDIENKFDPAYARRLGINMKNLKVMKSTSLELSLNAMIALCSDESFPVDLIVVDSIGAASSARIEGTENDTMAIAARVISMGISIINRTMKINNTTFLFINQGRANITQQGAFGDKYPGGNAYEHSLCLSIRFKKLPLRKNASEIPFDMEAKVDKVKAEGVIKGDSVILTYTGNGDNILEGANWLEDALKEMTTIKLQKNGIKIGKTLYGYIDISKIPKDELIMVIEEDNAEELARLAEIYKDQEILDYDEE